MEFIIPGCRPAPPLRVSGKMLHLTYAALYADELQHDFLLTAARQWATNRHGLREYVIARELHQEPADPERATHFHLYVKYGKKIDLLDRFHTTVFDLRGRDQRILHPEIQTVMNTPGDRERVIRYDMKDGDYIGELETALVDDPRRDQQEADEHGDDDDAEGADKVPKWARMLNKANSVREGMMLLADMVPHVYYTRGSAIKQMLAERVGIPQTKLFSLADFIWPALDLDMPIVLHGDTAYCKTAYAKAHFDHPLVVRRPDDLKRISGPTDGIIFDDCTFRNWSAEDALCLLDWDEARSLPARYSDAFIEADIPIIFTTNRRPQKIFPRAESAKQRRAIKRRYRAVEVSVCLARNGRPATPAEKRARREAGQNGPRGPAADAAEQALFG